MELFDSRDLQFAVNVHELKQDVDTDMKKLTTVFRHYIRSDLGLWL